MMQWCLMSSDVSWHIRDKLWPMPKHGSVILYVQGNQKSSLGRTAQDGHLDSHTAPELWCETRIVIVYVRRTGWEREWTIQDLKIYIYEGNGNSQLSTLFTSSPRERVIFVGTIMSLTEPHKEALSGTPTNSKVRLCCLMSSDVSWHIGDKLRPMPKHGSLLLYVHGNHKAC